MFYLKKYFIKLINGFKKIIARRAPKIKINTGNKSEMICPKEGKKLFSIK
jgi:hypothetical protein